MINNIKPFVKATQEDFNTLYFLYLFNFNLLPYPLQCVFINW